MRPPAGPQVPQRGTCKGACPTTDRTHDLPDPTSDATRSGEAGCPEQGPDHTRPGPTAPSPGPEPPDARAACRTPHGRQATTPEGRSPSATSDPPRRPCITGLSGRTRRAVIRPRCSGDTSSTDWSVVRQQSSIGVIGSARSGVAIEVWVMPCYRHAPCQSGTPKTATRLSQAAACTRACRPEPVPLHGTSRLYPTTGEHLGALNQWRST
jgi:hypothetical protein